MTVDNSDLTVADYRRNLLLAQQQFGWRPSFDDRQYPFGWGSSADPVRVDGQSIDVCLAVLSHGLRDSRYHYASMEFAGLAEAVLSGDDTLYSGGDASDEVLWIWATALQPGGVEILDAILGSIDESGTHDAVDFNALIGQHRDVYADVVGLRHAAVLALELHATRWKR